MKVPELHKEEEQRLRSLRSLKILDTMAEDEFDEITQLASNICNTKISLISLVDEDRQWFKSKVGLEADETPRDYSFCAHAINGPDEIFQIENSLKHEDFKDNPLATDDPHVIFYAGISIKDPNGLPLGTLCVIDDHPRKLSKSQGESLKLLGKQVNRMIKRRAQQLIAESMRDDLARQNKELEKFAHSISHDIKNPVSNLQGLAEILLVKYSDAIDEEGVKMLNYIQKSSITLKNLVNGMLTYYKSSLSLRNEKNSFKLSDLFDELVPLIDPGAEVDFTLPEGEHEISAHYTALEQIFLNLMTNATKYNSKKNRMIDVGFREDDTTYYFSVKDNGDGVGKEDLNKIFDYFTNFGKTDREGKKGTGIGLASVKRTIEYMGGNIKFESELKKGSIARFEIPK